MKRLIHYILLIAISFSVLHGVILDTHQDEHCSVKEFVAEFSHPIQHDIDEHDGDLCNSHFMLHLSFILPQHFLLLEIKKDNFNLPFKEPSKSYSYMNNSFRPPIA